ncbi:hypothetical protein PZH37_18300, partial [[Eubacterium] siraeum]|nr:hypothetical protein [[Eubacterium] siraeum]
MIPHGENSFWLDGLSTGHKYCTYVGEELIDYIRNTFGLAQKLLASNQSVLALGVAPSRVRAA